MFPLFKFLTKAPVTAPNLLKTQTRNTFILKRRNPIPLHRKGGRPQKLRNRHFIYDLVQDTNLVRQPDLKLILTQYVEGIGYAGDCITQRPIQAYRDFLLPGLAVYATPANVEKYKVDETKPRIEEQFSSPYVKMTMSQLSRTVLNISMNKFNPWVLEPWHVSVSFRKAGFVVPDYAIEMPPVEIKGPDLSLQEKEFYVTVTINKTEKVNVRCRIYHWATGVDKEPFIENHWKIPLEPLIPEQAEVLANLPLPE